MKEQKITPTDLVGERPTKSLRLARKIFHLLYRSETEREVIRQDIRYRLKPKEYPDYCIIRNNNYEPQQAVHFFEEAEKRNADVFLDIGAYFGYYSLLAARLGIFKEIHAIEASPQNYTRLQWHINANHMGDIIQPHQIVASDREDKINFLTQGPGSTVVSEDVEKITQTQKVCAQTVDSLFDWEGKTLAIKMDVENHEVPVLRGCQKLISKNNIFLQVEVLSNQEATIDYLLANGSNLTYHIMDEFYFERNIDDGKMNGQPKR